MLAAMDALVRAIDAHPRPVVAPRARRVPRRRPRGRARVRPDLGERAARALGCPEIKLGVLAPFAAALLPRRVGMGRALELILSGEATDARTALAMGLIERTFPDETFEKDAKAALERLADRSGPALGVARRAVREAIASPDLDAALPPDAARLPEQHAQLADAREGLAAFIEKRPAVWQDR